MANAIKNFHFDYLHTSLSRTQPSGPLCLWQCLEKIKDQFCIGVHYLLVYVRVIEPHNQLQIIGFSCNPAGLLSGSSTHGELITIPHFRVSFEAELRQLFQTQNLSLGKLKSWQGCGQPLFCYFRPLC